MAEMSKRIRVRLQNSKYVQSSVEEHAPMVSKIIGLLLNNFDAEGAEGLLHSLSDHLKLETEQLEALERAYIKEQNDDPGVLEARNKAATQTYDFLQGVRGFVRRHDVKKLSIYALEKSLPNSRPQLLEYAINAHEKLSEGGPSIPGFAGMNFDPLLTAQALKTLIDTFSTSMGAVLKESRELETALIARDKSLESWQKAYKAISNILVAFYQLADEPEMAHRVRPTQRKSRGELLIANEPSNASNDDSPETTSED